MFGIGPPGYSSLLLDGGGPGGAGGAGGTGGTGGAGGVGAVIEVGTGPGVAVWGGAVGVGFDCPEETDEVVACESAPHLLQNLDFRGFPHVKQASGRKPALLNWSIVAKYQIRRYVFTDKRCRR